MNARFVRIRLSALAATMTVVACSTALAQDPAPPAAPPPSAAPPVAPPPPVTPAPPAVTKPSVARADLPAAKDILNQSIDAMGGEKAFDAIKSSMVKASMSTPMGDIALELNWMSPNMVFIKQSMPGNDSTMGSDGSVSWVKGPTGYRILDAEQAKLMQDQSNMFRMVLKMRDDSKELKTVDQVSYAETDCYKVSATNNDGLEQFAFFDVKEKLIRGMESTEESPMGAVTSTIKFSEWKEDAGIKYFSKMDVEQMGMTMTLAFTEVKFNSLSQSDFVLPDEVKAMLKEKETAPTTPPPATAPTAPADPSGRM